MSKSFITGSIFFTALSLSVHASLIFGSPAIIPDDNTSSVFLNSGDFVVSMDVRDGGATHSTLNGVTFLAGNYNNTLRRQSITANGVTVLVDATSSGLEDADTGALLYTKSAALNEVYDVLGTSLISVGGGAIQISFSGLTVGQTYRLQTLHLADTGTEGSRDMVYSDGIDTSSPFSMAYTEGVISGGIANTLTFTADASTKNISLAAAAAGDRSYLNGLSLYAVPEPATFSLMGAALLVICLVRRIRM